MTPACNHVGEGGPGEATSIRPPLAGAGSTDRRDHVNRATPIHPVRPEAAVLRDLSHSPDQRFWLLREVQKTLERSALRGPVLFAVDDVQWADAALTRMEAAGALRIALESLDQAAVADVAADLLGGIPDRALAKVLAGVRGQPSLLAELLGGLSPGPAVRQCVRCLADGFRGPR